MLRTRLLTAAVAIPSLWLFVAYAPAAYFALFIVVVTALGLYEYFAMASRSDSSWRRASRRAIRPSGAPA